MIASNHLEVVDKRRAATREYLKRGMGIDAARGMAICQSKRLYSSAHEAKRRAKYYKRRYGWKQTAYRCPVCGNWHLRTTKETGD